MSLPGPTELGRAVVVSPGAPPPAAWARCERVSVDAALAADPARLADVVAGLHEAWAARTPVVVELGLDAAELAHPEASAAAPWELGATFTFLRERLHFLVWANSYDARRDPPVWWWAVKAEAAGATVGGGADVVARLHEAWAARTPVVVELGLDAADLAQPEASAAAPWELGAAFTFLRERLHFLVWANSYDARRDPPVWWWAVKAEAAGATVGGEADVVLPDGRPAWIDGGPRGPLTIEEPVVHSESVTLGRLTPVPAAVPPPAGLAPDQAEAVAHGSGPARIIAPAGSGKTRTLTARFRHLLEDRAVEPELVAAVAYNNRAAAEMRERLEGNHAGQVRTIHSLGWRILREGRGDLTLLDERNVRARLDPMVKVPRRPNADVVGPYLEALAEVRIGLRAPQDVEAERDDVPDFADVFARYRETLARRREADFDEQVYGAIEVLAADPDLRRRWQGRSRHLLVDEFQDLTPAYLLLIRLLASPALDVFAVGDDDQTIYGYLGADPGFLIDYPQLFPGAGAHALEVNYRCPVAVVEAAANVVGYNRRRLRKTIRPGPDAVPGTDGVAIRRTKGEGLAAAAADVVGLWLADGEPSDIAVLCRVNSALLPVHAALAERGVPFESPLGPDLLRRSVLAAGLAWLRLGQAPEAMRRADLLAAVRRPSRGLNRLAADLLPHRTTFSLDDLGALGERLDGRQAGRWADFVHDLEQVADAAAGGDAAALLDVVITRVGLESAAQALDSGRTRVDRSAQSDDLVAIRRAAAIHPALDGFEAWLREMLARPSTPGGVLLTTVHRVKGMEWDRVLIFGADRGLMPHALSTDWEEERRVFHVALTRGRRKVVILADRARPSPFLEEMAGTASRAAAPAPPPPKPEKLVLAPGVTGDPELVARLKEWRLHTARTRGVPAYVVMHDSTLDAIAAAKPQTERELASVPGIGPAKLDAYGDDLLALCSE